MADRFFLVCADDKRPLVEFLDVESFEGFTRIIGLLGSDDELMSVAWGVVLDESFETDPKGVPPSDVSFVLTKILLRRLLQYNNPARVSATHKVDDLKAFLHRVWRV